MIRDAVLHLLNDQPLLADLFTEPGPGDAVIVCTNVRTLHRTRPIFVDRSDSTFVFPYKQVRFVEIPPTAAGEAGGDEAGRRAHAPPAAPARLAPGPEAELELDEDFLRRVREA